MSSVQAACDAHSEEDWTLLEDPLERRRIQNRVAQRNHRRNLKRRLEYLEKTIQAQTSLAEPPSPLERNTLRKYSQARVRAANLNQLCDIEQGTLLMSRADHKSTSHSTQTLSPALNKQLAESVSRIPVADAIYNSEEAYTACSGGGLTTNEAYATDFTGNGIDSHNSIDLSEGNQNVSPGKSALHMAVESKSLPMVSLILDQGVSVNIPDNLLQCPIHLAVKDGPIDVVNLLLEKGAKVDETDILGQTALHVAASAGMDSALRSLVDRTENMDARNSSGFTPLHCAIINGHEEAARILLSRGADLSATN